MTVRYGVIGTGMMGCEHIRNLVEISDAEVVAIADPNDKPLDWARAACGNRFNPAVYKDYHDLLADDNVDAVLIASPNFTHIDVLKAVYQTDKHVMVEKPMCTTLADCQYVVEAAEQHHGITWVGLEYRYMTPTTRLLEEIQSGAVGDLKMLFIREHRFPFLKKVGNWNRFNENTGGTLVEKCCHFFDLMNLAIEAEPLRAYASGGQDVNHLDEEYDGRTPDILDNAFVIVDYDNGVRACLDLCMFAESSPNEQELVATGSRGKVSVTIPEGAMIKGGREHGKYTTENIAGDSRVQHQGFHFGASYLEHLDFIEAIQNGQPAKVTPVDGLKSVAIGVAAQESIETGVPVEVFRL